LTAIVGTRDISYATKLNRNKAKNSQFLNPNFLLMILQEIKPEFIPGAKIKVI